MSQGVTGLDLSPLKSQSAFIAQVELRETSVRVKEATAALRGLLKERKNLYFRDDNDFLIRFLRPTKFYPKSALRLMVNIAKFKKKYSKYLDNLAPKEDTKAMREYNIFSVLAERDKRGRKIFVLNFGESWDPSQVTAAQIFRVIYMVHIAVMMEPETQVKGIVAIVDLKGLQMKQLRALSGFYTRVLLELLQNALPLRLKEIHFVNHPSAFTTFFTLFRPFICTKLYKRIFFHRNELASLHSLVDPSRLPDEFGGSLAKLEFTSNDWHAILLEVEEAIREWGTFGFVGDARQ